MHGRLPTYAGLLLLAAAAVCVQAGRLAPTGDSAGGNDDGKTRTYFLAANQVIWDFAPSGQNLCQGRNFSDEESLYTEQGIGSRYIKARFERYLHANFTEKETERPAEERHLGILGPLLRAAVGDTMEVHLLNNLSFPINLAPGGVSYSAADNAKVAEPGQMVVYTWTVPEQAGPSPEQNTSSVMWMYRSTVDQQQHADAGLFGPIVITRAADADADGRPTDVDMEFITLFEVLNENGSPFLEDNQRRFGGRGGQGGLSDEDFEEANLKHSINGYLYCNVPALNMSSSDRVRWHTTVQGNEVDIHNVHWHGLVLMEDGTHADQFNLFPSTTRTATLITDNPGTWLLHCHVNDHFSAGMLGLVTVTGPPTDDFELTGATRTYYVQAEEQLWEYAPTGGNMCSGRRADFTEDEAVYTTVAPNRIGGNNLKARYVEYTDDTFKIPRRRTPAEAHLGILGPVIRAEVGDEVIVHFRNKIRFPTTIHVHGLLYNKSSEGSPYSDGTRGADKADDGVPTNETHTYVYQVPERSGPGPAEPTSKLWMYHSHADEAADTYAGLMGAVIVSRRGTSRPDGTPLDVDREFVLFWSVMNEAQSFMFVANLNKYLASKYVGNGLPEVHSSMPAASANNSLGGDASGGTPVANSVEQLAAPGSPLEELLADEDGFQESNLKHAVNGYLYCNLPGLTVTEGQRARFYVMSLGTEADLHSPNLEAATLDWEGQATEALEFLPGNMETADAQLTAPGRWLFQCRTADHIAAGMQALFTVQPGDSSELPEVPEESDDDSEAAAPAQDGPQVSLAAADSSTTDQPTTAGAIVAAPLPPDGERAIYNSGVSGSGANAAAAYSAAAAGSPARPIASIAFAFAQAIRKALFGVPKPTLEEASQGYPADVPLSQSVVRTYYIQAERGLWDFLPSGVDRCVGAKPEGDQQLYTMTLNNTLGSKAHKALYRAYSNDSFKTALPHSEFLGVMGPLIQAQVGDVLKIVFRNDLNFETNLFLGGGLLPVDPELAAAGVKSGKTVTVKWQVPREAGPKADDPSSVHYVYYSTVDTVAHQYSGLVGVVMVTRPATLTTDGRIPSIDVIQPLLFDVWDESKSVFFEDNIQEFNPTADQDDPDFEEGNLKHGINGYLYCNQPDVRVPAGGKVRWLLVGMGTENDMHSPVFHGQVLQYDQKHTLTAQLFPAVTRTADMQAVSPGTWRYNCDVQDHIAAGMEALLVVAEA